MKIRGMKETRYPQVNTGIVLVPVKQVTYGLTARLKRGRFWRVSVLVRFTERAVVPEAFRDDNDGQRCEAPPPVMSWLTGQRPEDR